MSSSIDKEQYVFEQTPGDNPEFIYGLREDGYDELNFMGALEADVDIVIDLENREGFYRPRMDDSDLAEAVTQINQYAVEQGFDTYNITFQEENDSSWRSVIASVWKNVNSEEEGKSIQQEAPRQVADGGRTSESVEGHSIVGRAETSPVGMDHSQDSYRFDSTEGWDWD